MARKRVYDGRGDKLHDARKTEFAGRAADDLRLGVLHLRLLAHFGRQNALRGWVRVSQKELASTWKVSRGRVSTAIGELAQWGYVRKVDQATTHESLCYYQTVLDEPFEGGGVSPIGNTPPSKRGVPPGEQVCSAEGTGVFPGWNTPPAAVYRERAHRLSPTIADRPYSPASGTEEDLSNSASEKLLTQVQQAGVSERVVDGLLAPIVLHRRFSHADKLAALTELGRLAETLEPEALARAKADVLDSGIRTIKAERLRKAIDDAIKGGARVVVKPGSANWYRWLEHLDQHEPQAAALARKLGIYQARTEWPVKPQAQAVEPQAPPPAEWTLEPGDIRREAWLAHHRANGGHDEARLIDRMRAAINVATPWPPDSADVLVDGGNATIPHGTPEHAAWLAVLRATGLPGKVQAQELDMGRRAILRPSRWPELNANAEAAE